MEEPFNQKQFHVAGLRMNPDYLAPGTHVAYFYKGKIHVGICETGLNAGERRFTVKNLNTGKIEYPYTQEVIMPDSQAASVEPVFQLKPLY